MRRRNHIGELSLSELLQLIEENRCAVKYLGALLLPPSVVRALEMAATNVALSLAILEGLLVVGIMAPPVAKFAVQTVKDSTFTASNTEVRFTEKRQAKRVGFKRK